LKKCYVYKEILKILKGEKINSIKEKKTKFWKIAIPINIILFLILFDAVLAPFLESRMIAESYYCYAILRSICHQLPTMFWNFFRSAFNRDIFRQERD